VIEQHGFTVPILLRKTRGGLNLIDGAHRLAAMKRLGSATIPAMIIECTSEEARALEASQNLAGASMSPLDDALFLAAYAKAYKVLHPETKGGVKGGLARHGLANELSSFAEIIAEKRSISVRQVQKIVSAGRKITRDEADHLRTATRKVTLKDVEDIGKIGDDDERAQVVLKLAGGQAKNAAAALRMQRAEVGGAVVMTPKDAAFNALINAWRRAPTSVRKRFCLEARHEIWEAQNKGAPLTNLDEAADE
jgi:ParB family chromosome partitioning protein